MREWKQYVPSFSTFPPPNEINTPQSAGSLASFFLACVRFGDSFIPKAQAELDRVVGGDRLPTFDDLASLEYVRAIVSETLRWRPVAVLGGTPHATTADDVYKGMFIPKGSTIIAPLWSSKCRQKVLRSLQHMAQTNHPSQSI